VVSVPASRCDVAPGNVYATGMAGAKAGQAANVPCVCVGVVCRKHRFGRFNRNGPVQIRLAVPYAINLPHTLKVRHLDFYFFNLVTRTPTVT
jgi:hypothetical protein